MSASLRLQSPPSYPPSLDNTIVSLLTSAVILPLTRLLTFLADDPEFDDDAFAWYCAEAANNSQTLQPPYSTYDNEDQNTGVVQMMDQDSGSYPWHTGASLPQSQFWPYQASSANGQSLSPANEPIPIAYAEYPSDEQAGIAQPISTSATAKRPHGQLHFDEVSTGDEQLTPSATTSASSTLRSPPPLKAPRRTTPHKSQVSALAVTHPNRTPHNLIERRYRHKLQSELDNLTSKIPGWDTTESADGIDIESAEVALKNRSKASAIAAAAKHIEALERDNESKALFVETLQGQIEGLQKLVHCDDCAIMRCLQESRMACQGG
jgi:hypothetical protein